MSSLTFAEKGDKDDMKEIPIGVKWEWSDEGNGTGPGLTYRTTMAVSDKNEKKNVTKGRKIDVRSGTPRLVKQDRKLTDNPSKSDLKKQLSANVTVTDIKNAAIYMLGERYYIPAEFEKFCNESGSKGILEEFLVNLANYFHWFFEAKDARVLTNPLCIDRSASEKQRIEASEKNLNVTLKALAKGYSMLILGIGAVEYHHMNCGKSRVSCAFRDRGIFETLYPFCVFFIWICFMRRDYDNIKKEIGRLMKSDAFNNNSKAEQFNQDDEEEKDKKIKMRIRDKSTILAHFEMHKLPLSDTKNTRKTASAALLNQRSPALVSLLPLPQEQSKFLFAKKGDNYEALLKEELSADEKVLCKQNVGIIGQPIKLFNLKTLIPRGSNEDECNDTKADFTSSEHQTTEKESHHEEACADYQSQFSRPTTVASMVYAND